MHITKPLDFASNIFLNVTILENLKGSVHSPLQKAKLSLATSEASINDFLENLNNDLEILVNNKPVRLSKQGQFFEGSLEFIKDDIESIVIKAQGKTLADYTIENNKATLQREVLFDSHLIKNSILNKKIDLENFIKPPLSLKTDLHTHYAGSPSALGLVNLGVDLALPYPCFLLEKIGIKIKQYETENNAIRLNQLTKQDKETLENAMQIGVAEQIRFVDDSNLEDIYKLRKPFFQDPSLTKDVLTLIAKEYAQSGVSYVELSGSQIFDLDQDIQMLKKAGEVIPSLEKEFGVKIRFLGAMTRFDDVEWSKDQLEKLKLVAKNPFVVGVDVVGHESNSTLDVVDNIEPYMQFSNQQGLDWVFRFHAGENPSHPENVKEALKLAKKHNVKVRIGHGLFGIDEEAIKLAQETKAVIEINASSNLALNNVSDLSEMSAISTYLDNGIDIVLGTDSPGIYQTSSPQ